MLCWPVGTNILLCIDENGRHLQIGYLAENRGTSHTLFAALIPLRIHLRVRVELDATEVFAHLCFSSNIDIMPLPVIDQPAACDPDQTDHAGPIAQGIGQRKVGSGASFSPTDGSTPIKEGDP